MLRSAYRPLTVSQISVSFLKKPAPFGRTSTIWLHETAKTSTRRRLNFVRPKPHSFPVNQSLSPTLFDSSSKAKLFNVGKEIILHVQNQWKFYTALGCGIHIYCKVLSFKKKIKQSRDNLVNIPSRLHRSSTNAVSNTFNQFSKYATNIIQGTASMVTNGTTTAGVKVKALTGYIYCFLIKEKNEETEDSKEKSSMLSFGFDSIYSHMKNGVETTVQGIKVVSSKSYSLVGKITKKSDEEISTEESFLLERVYDGMKYGVKKTNDTVNFTLNKVYEIGWKRNNKSNDDNQEKTPEKN